MIKRNIRILYISDAASIHVRRWAKSFAYRGYDVHLVSPTPWGETTVKTTVMPLYPYGASNPLSRMVNGLKNVIDLRKFMRRLNPHIIHLHGLFTVFGPDLMFTVFRQNNLVVSTWGSDVVCTPGGKEPFRSIAIKKFIFRQAAAVLATSKHQSRLTQKYCPRYRQVITTPFGVDLELFRKNGAARQPPGVVTLGFVKRLEVNYGPHILLEAFKIVANNHQNIKLFMIGEGSMKQSLMESAERWGLREKVLFPGEIENHRIPFYLNQMDIFVMPSLRETFGVAAVEAQAAEVPVIATNVEGVREVVIHKKTGLLIDPLDPKALAASIVELIRDPEKRERMGVAGREFVSRHYDWKRNVDKVERIYHGLLHDG